MIAIAIIINKLNRNNIANYFKKFFLMKIAHLAIQEIFKIKILMTVIYLLQFNKILIIK